MQNFNKNNTLFEKTPKISQKQRVYKVSTKSISVKHAPENTNPTTIQEFMKVAKQYWEFSVDVKQNIGRRHVITSYRCLFSSQTKSEQERKKLEDIMNDQSLKIAMEEYKRSKWLEELEKQDQDNTQEEGDTNENF